MPTRDRRDVQRVVTAVWGSGAAEDRGFDEAPSEAVVRKLPL